MLEEVLTAVTMNDLISGNLYVKSGDHFYLMPKENCTFDASKPAASSEKTTNGMTDPEENRLLSYLHKDAAIPTLYKNDQLIYVSNKSLPSFSWERFVDLGYSLGLSGLNAGNSGKITSGESTILATGSTAAAAVTSMQLQGDTVLTVDTINGTLLSPQYLNANGIITGMSRDAVANVDFYVGTQHVQSTISADTRYFRSFELYQTSKYSLSPDGYAIIDIPSYLKSGYYFINNVGLVKFLNVDRGVDESGITLDMPYYYLGSDGKILTYYEWLEANGMVLPETSSPTQSQKIDIGSYPDRMRFSLDSTQAGLNITVTYRYISAEHEAEANRNGSFPRATLLKPDGTSQILEKDEALTNSRDNKEGNTFLTSSVDGAVAGEWNLLFSNFDNTYRFIDTGISSGNATSYLHNAQTGNIEIYYEASNAPHDFIITWERKDRAISEAKITAPDKTIYSREKTPGNIMADEFGRYVIKVPSLASGKYRFDIKGDQIGRVWIDSKESVALEQASLNTAQVETNVTTETSAAHEAQEADKKE